MLTDLGSLAPASLASLMPGWWKVCGGVTVPSILDFPTLFSHYQELQPEAHSHPPFRSVHPIFLTLWSAACPSPVLPS